MSESKEDRPFFIGWESASAPPLRAFLKKISALLLLAALGLAALVAALQGTVTGGRFEFGNVKEFSGLLVESPVPMLISDGSGDRTIYYLVAPLKYGFPKEVAAEHNLKHVTLKGTLIGNTLDSMIEVIDGSVHASGASSGVELGESAGTEVSLRGEIVDSKCHLGVMNPGRYKPHRACAIQCISGGIPPILVVQTTAGELAHYVLVGPSGEAINDAVLEFVAEPVELSGILKSVAGRKVLYVDPRAINRL